jgi:ribosome biogenesis GTPase
MSARDRTGLEALSAWLAPGATVALVGSSGAGKSTLVNALLGEARQAVHEVRASDARGRHTTTRRELFPLPTGALLIDTPGLREFQLWAEAADLGDAFPEIERLAKTCRFRDCRHESEPGCALTGAVEQGTLDPARLESWRKLQRELQWNAARTDQRLRLEREARWRAISRSMKHHPKADRWRR